MASPIWRDYYVTLGSGSYYDYDIRLGSAAGAVIYTGRAYKRPGADYVTIRINEIIADHLRNALPVMRPAGFTSFELAVAAFVLVGGSVVDSELFYNNWSYDPDFNPATMRLADPVDGLLDPRQHLLFSVFTTNELTATLTYLDGTQNYVTISIARSADFNNDFNADFSKSSVGAAGGAAILDISPFTGLASVAIGGVTYRVLQDTCAKYVAYYLNAYGGWDSLVLQGNDQQRAELTRHTALVDYDNRDQAARGWKDYAIEVAPAWTLRTGLLTDEQSARMHNLLESPDVYLCELATGRVLPVLLTDTEDARQSWRSNGKQVIQYAFGASLAQERLRR